MVGLFKALLAPLLLAAFVVAQDATFSITYPSANDWWVAQSSDVMAWNCTDPVAVSYGHWTVYINNTSPSVFTGPLGIIADLFNADCSHTVSHDQVNLPVGVGYYVIFANEINATIVYATSQLFEVKALGSAYPITSSASAASGTGAASSSASATAGSKNGATLGSHSPSFLVLTGIMGLLTVALLGVLS
jgi:hypothetical protein